ncbi:hypothetical protein J6590_061940 [Homalodisca vitripennis]|nr:hypothetical protein J6590_061940 [Homalodisca vitripennis]
MQKTLTSSGSPLPGEVDFPEHYYNRSQSLDQTHEITSRRNQRESRGGRLQRSTLTDSPRSMGKRTLCNAQPANKANKG